MTTLQSKISISKEVDFRDVEGEAVIMHRMTGKYFGLDQVGTRIWALLVEHCKVEPVYRALLDEYDVSAEQLQSDLFKLIDELARQKLVYIVDA